MAGFPAGFLTGAGRIAALGPPRSGIQSFKKVTGIIFNSVTFLRNRWHSCRLLPVVPDLGGRPWRSLNTGIPSVS